MRLWCLLAVARPRCASRTSASTRTDMGGSCSRCPSGRTVATWSRATTRGPGSTCPRTCGLCAGILTSAARVWPIFPASVSRRWPVRTMPVTRWTIPRLKTTARLGACDLVTGLAVSWSGIYPERQTADVIKAEIGAARVLGAKGFVMFHLDHFYDEHWRALKEATQ